jgi:glycosyltransferase involved in cell wall biosynthesis
MPNPVVSILTPTYNRREFLPGLIQMIRHQTYDLKKCEWIVLDDSPESNEDLFEDIAKLTTVRYCHHGGEKLVLGAKRNMLIDLARGEYMVWIDDDDFQMPGRISHSITMLDKFRQDVGGSSHMYLYFPDDETIWKYEGLHGPGHFTNGTFVCKRSYLLDRRYDGTAGQAEEATLSRNYDRAIVQLDPLKTILVRCHSGNTVDKRFTRLFNENMKPTCLKLRNFIKDPKLREEFRRNSAYKPNEPVRVPQSVLQRMYEEQLKKLNPQSAKVSACSGEVFPPERQCEGSSGPLSDACIAPSSPPDSASAESSRGGSA